MNKLRIKFLVWKIGRVENQMDNTNNYQKANKLYWKMHYMLNKLDNLKTGIEL